jgi:hypothetical protein
MGHNGKNFWQSLCLLHEGWAAGEVSRGKLWERTPDPVVSGRDFLRTQAAGKRHMQTQGLNRVRRSMERAAQNPLSPARGEGWGEGWLRWLTTLNYPDLPANLAPMAKAASQSCGKTSRRLRAFFSGSKRGATTLA